MIDSPLLRGPASILFPPQACNFCIFRSKSRNYQFYQIYIVSAPDQLDQAVCKVSLNSCKLLAYKTKCHDTGKRSGSDDDM